MIPCIIQVKGLPLLQEEGRGEVTINQEFEKNWN